MKPGRVRRRGADRDDRFVNCLFVVAVGIEGGWLYLRQFPEQFEFGEEVGLVASGLALSYISAFIFRRIVVLRPERRRRARFYAANWGPLCMISYNAQGLVHDFECIAGRSPRPYNNEEDFQEITEDYFRELVAPLSINVTGHFANRVKVWRDNWEPLKPFLYELEEGLALRLRAVEAVFAIKSFDNPPDEFQPANYKMEYWSDGRPRNLGHGWKMLWEYVAVTEELRSYVEALPLDRSYLDNGARFFYYEQFLPIKGLGRSSS